MPVRDQPGEWLRDEGFAAAFGARGRPGRSPSRLTLVTLLQRAENLTDRLAADAVRTRIDWKYLLGLSPPRPKNPITPGHTFIEAGAPVSIWCWGLS